jgi:hypothetical protein
MIAGVSYADAKAVVKSRPKRSGNCTSYVDLRFGLDSYGVAYEMNGRRAFRFTDWSEIPDRAIVAVECEPRRPGFWHWIVVDRVDGVRFVLDPLRRRVVRRGINKLRGRSYMTILGERQHAGSA